MDGELDDSSYKSIIKDAEIKRTWHRFHLISDIMHQCNPVHTQTILSQRISDSIKQEPAILAPTNKSLPAYFKPIAGLAVAASVAAIAIMGIQQLQTSTPESAPQIAQVQRPQVVPSPQIQQANLVTSIPVQLRQTQAVRSGQLQMTPDLRINRYILNHNEYQSNLGLSRMAPNIRLVSTGTI